MFTLKVSQVKKNPSKKGHPQTLVLPAPRVFPMSQPVAFIEMQKYIVECVGPLPSTQSQASWG